MSTYRKTRFSVSHIIFCYIIISHSIGAVWQSYKTYKLYNLDLFFSYEEKKEITSQLTNSNFNIQGRILTTPPEKLNLSSIEFPKNVHVIVIVCQTPEDVESRRQIRQGWANKANYEEKNNSIYVLFLVGTRNNSVSPILLKESNEYGDIFIADIEESYQNLVYKLMVVYNWISHFLYPVYVVKIDNDTVIDLNQLTKVISDQTTEKWIVGKVVERAMPSRDPNNKYYISPEDYRGSVFPSYTDGPLYIISPGALKEIVLHLDVHPAIHLEDVYFTGILASNASIPLISDISYFIYLFFCLVLLSWLMGALGDKNAEPIGTALFSSDIAEYEKAISEAAFNDSKKNLTIRERILGLPAQALNLSFVSVSKNVKVFVVVCQTPEDKEARRQIRAGWANKTNSQDIRNGSIFVIFLVGKRNNSVDPNLLEESKEFGDIFIADVEESYSNLVYKLMVVYKWISGFHISSFVVKIDNDMIIDLNQLKPIVSEQTEEKWILGRVVKGAIPDRNNKSARYVSMEAYPQITLPDYADHQLYIISPFAFSQMLASLHAMKEILPEDVYFTGKLAGIAQVTLKSNDRIFNKKPNCKEISPNTFAFSAKNSQLGLLEEYNWLTNAKKGNCT